MSGGHDRRRDRYNRHNDSGYIKGFFAESGGDKADGEQYGGAHDRDNAVSVLFFVFLVLCGVETGRSFL